MRGLVAVVVVAMLAAFLGVVAASGPPAGIAGSTSRYMRKLAESVDLPYDSPLFAVPKGANPPQQVLCASC